MIKYESDKTNLWSIANILNKKESIFMDDNNELKLTSTFFGGVCEIGCHYVAQPRHKHMIFLPQQWIY